MSDGDLVLELERPWWQSWALCRWYPAGWWFDRRRGSTRASRCAKGVCARCPVRAECLAFAVESGERAGIWGGLTEIERRGLRPGTQADWRRRDRRSMVRTFDDAVAATVRSAFAPQNSFACAHVLAGHRARLVCMDHPELGVLCGPCFEEHGDRPACSVCGAVDVELAEVSAPWLVAGPLMLRSYLSGVSDVPSVFSAVGPGALLQFLGMVCRRCAPATPESESA